MTAPLKPIDPPVLGPIRTDQDRETAFRELERKVRALTVQVNDLVKRLQEGKEI